MTALALIVLDTLVPLLLTILWSLFLSHLGFDELGQLAS